MTDKEIAMEANRKSSTIAVPKSLPMPFPAMQLRRRPVGDPAETRDALRDRRRMLRRPARCRIGVPVFTKPAIAPG